MRVLVAMSGGVDSSVAAARLVEAGHAVTGVTLKLWAGDTDSGCCTLRDVEDARRVAAHLGIAHYVFNLTDDFTRHVVDPYVAEHAAGRTPNPCVECNVHLKWGRLRDRAGQLGFDALATGHHARIERRGADVRLRRGVDPAKDQSYVLARLAPAQLVDTLLPVGELTKAEVREHARALGLRTADKAESMDVCFVARRDRVAFLDARLAPRPGRVVTTDGADLGAHDGVARFTVGQRRGLGIATGERLYVVDVDPPTATVTVGTAEELGRSELPVRDPSWLGPPPRAGDRVLAQTSAHGSVLPGRWQDGRVALDVGTPRVAAGQVVALYDPARPDTVLGAALAA